MRKNLHVKNKGVAQRQRISLHTRYTSLVRRSIKKTVTLCLITILCTSSSPSFFVLLIESLQTISTSGVAGSAVPFAQSNTNMASTYTGGVERASAALNSAEREYLLDIGPINASTTANYVYTSFFNPSGSGRTIAIKHLAVRADTASSTASNYVNLSVRRISAASLGTQITTTNIPKKNTTSSDSIAEVRYGGVTATFSGTIDSRILGQPLSGAVGSFYSNRDVMFNANDEMIILQQGEGIAVYQEAAGAMATKVRVLVEWDESGNAPSAQGEFLFAFPRVEVAATTGYVYNSFFNPGTSGKTAIVKRIWFGTETCDAVAVYTNRISIRRTTAASAGTAITASNIPKKNTSSSNSVMEFRHTNVSATLVGTSDARLASVTPCGTTGQYHGWQQINFDSGDEKLILQQGEGIALFSETAGDVDQLVRMIVEWQEVSSGNTPASEGEYLFASSGVQAAVAANTTQYTFFNPVGSGKTAIIKRASLRVDATSTGAYSTYSFRRLTTASGGTLIAASDLSDKHSGTSASIMEMRWCGLACGSAITTAYVGTADSRLLSVTSPGAVAQTIGQRDIVFGSNEDIVLQPGEGIGLYNEILTSSVGNVARISLEWKEQVSAPTARNQYLIDIGPVNGTTSTSINYATFFNPASSGKSAVIKRLSVRVDAVAASVYIPVQVRRITATTLGTQIATSSIPKKHSGTATSSMEIRYGGATTTTSYFGTADSKIIGVQTPGAVGSAIAGNTGYKEIIFTPNEDIILQAGQGIALYHEAIAGDADMRTRLLVEWEEVTSASSPVSLSEFLMTTGAITQSTVANYIYTTFFNPAASANNYVLKRIGVQVDRSGTAVTPAYTPVSVRRITSASLGTAVASTSVTRKNTDTATSSAEIRTTGVTASFSGVSDSRLLGVTTPGVVNQVFGDDETSISLGDEFIVQPGEGVALYQEQATGDALVRYRFAFEWKEVASSSPVQSITFTISTSTVYFGVVSPVLTRYASGTNALGSNTEVEAHTFTINTNAVNGYTVTTKGQTLTSGSVSIAAIGATATTSLVGSEQFGIRLTAAGGSGTTSPPYNTSGFAYDATATTSSVVATASVGDNATTTFSVRYIANIAPITQPSTYTANIIYVATANF